jgi:hypothetical protein
MDVDYTFVYCYAFVYVADCWQYVKSVILIKWGQGHLIQQRSRSILTNLGQVASSPVCYVAIFSFALTFWRLVKLYIFGNIMIYWVWKLMIPYFHGWNISMAAILDIQNGGYWNTHILALNHKILWSWCQNLHTLRALLIILADLLKAAILNL